MPEYTCVACIGSGIEPGGEADTDPCHVCNGEGHITMDDLKDLEDMTDVHAS